MKEKYFYQIVGNDGKSNKFYSDSRNAKKHLQKHNAINCTVCSNTTGEILSVCRKSEGKIFYSKVL